VHVTRFGPGPPAGLPIWRLLGDAGCAPHEVAESYLHALQRLWLAGAQLEWAGLGAAFTKHSKRIQLPRYPFEGETFGPDQLREKFAAATESPPRRRNLQAVERLATVAEWLSVPSFARASPLPAAEATPCPRRVLFLGGSGSGAEAALVMELTAAGHTVNVVELTSERAALPGGFGVRGGEHLCDDLRWVLRQLPAMPQQVVHCWGLAVRAEHAEAEAAAALAWHGLVALGSAVGAEPAACTYYTAVRRLDVRVLAAGLFSVLGEPANPLASLLLGPAVVLPQENPTVTVQVRPTRSRRCCWGPPWCCPRRTPPSPCRCVQPTRVAAAGARRGAAPGEPHRHRAGAC
jgi:hypothetical protein